MVNSKKRRPVETYERYWKFTAAHTNIMGMKFNNCLRIIVDFIDKNKKELLENAEFENDFRDSDLYKNLQEKIIEISGFKGKDAGLSARKVINQYVKIGFVEPFLVGYHNLVKDFLREENNEKKKIIFSKIFYENSSLASDVTLDNKRLKHVNFLLQTLDRNKSLNREDIIALMVTDVQNHKKGYLDAEELDLQYKYARQIGFEDRKYNQISHLKSYLKWFVDVKYDKDNEKFWFADDPNITDKDFNVSYKRDGVKHRLYKEELKEESRSIYGKQVCYLDKMPYKSLVASHIKPWIDCAKEGREDQAYDVNNGLLLSPTVDSYFDKQDLTFLNDGTIIFGINVEDEIKEKLGSYKLDVKVLNIKRQRYLEYHRRLFVKKNGDII